VPGLIQSTQPTPPVSVEPSLDDEADEPDALNEHVESPGDPDGLIAEEERRKWQTEHPASPPVNSEKPRKRRWLVAVIIVILIGAAAVGAYWFGGKQAKKQPAQTPKTVQTKTEQQAQQKQAADVPAKHYDSTTYSLGLDYPETWKVTDTAAKLIVVSPTMSLPSSKGTTVNGHVVVMVQRQQSAITGYPASGATAVLASKKLTYKQPSTVQRAQTYLTYLSYGNDALDALFITGDSGYQQSQSVPQGDVIRADPLISVAFQNCTSDDCATGTPTQLTLMASKWDGLAVSTQLTTLLESLTLN
jgi:hypothetical protein